MMPMATPISACFESRCVVHPVDGHRHHVAVALQRLDDPEFVLGGYPGVDGCAAHRLNPSGVVEGAELGTRDDPGAVAGEAEVAGDGDGDGDGDGGTLRDGRVLGPDPHRHAKHAQTLGRQPAAGRQCSGVLLLVERDGRTR
ncbi:MAG: hypothetical protein QOE19_2776 [Actinomycetota bacterium]|nr:hypothetical protein [Actinomycetota bacterium]MDQ1666532.1 hypothetical protein [Actinomycetota bacterium]